MKTVLTVLLIIIALVILLIGIILILPVTVTVSYDGKEPRYDIRILGIRLRSGKKKLVRIKKGQRAENNSQQEKLLDELADVKKILPSLLKRATGAFKLKKLNLKVKIATGDPYDTAISYGTVHAAVYAIVALLEGCIVIENKNISITADYMDEQTEITLHLLFHSILLKVIHAIILLIYDEVVEIL